MENEDNKKNQNNVIKNEEKEKEEKAEEEKEEENQTRADFEQKKTKDSILKLFEEAGFNTKDSEEFKGKA